MFSLKIPEHAIIRSTHFPNQIFGACMKKDETWCIGIDSSLTGFEKDRIIAHEIGHCMDDSCLEDNKYSEQRAEQIACEILIPKGKLKKIIENGWQTIDEIHLFFPSATRDMVEKSCKSIYV